MEALAERSRLAGIGESADAQPPERLTIAFGLGDDRLAPIHDAWHVLL